MNAYHSFVVNVYKNDLQVRRTCFALNTSEQALVHLTFGVRAQRKPSAWSNRDVRSRHEAATAQHHSHTTCACAGNSMTTRSPHCLSARSRAWASLKDCELFVAADGCVWPRTHWRFYVCAWVRCSWLFVSDQSACGLKRRLDHLCMLDISRQIYTCAGMHQGLVTTICVHMSD